MTFEGSVAVAQDDSGKKPIRLCAAGRHPARRRLRRSVNLHTECKRVLVLVRKRNEIAVAQHGLQDFRYGRSSLNAGVPEERSSSYIIISVEEMTAPASRMRSRPIFQFHSAREL